MELIINETGTPPLLQHTAAIQNDLNETVEVISVDGGEQTVTILSETANIAPAGPAGPQGEDGFTPQMFSSVSSWRSPYRALNGTVASFVSGRMILIPFLLPNEVEVSAIAMQYMNTPSADYSNYFVIYDNQGFMPNNLVVNSGLLATGTVSGVITSTLASPVVLPPGVYWYGTLPSGTTLATLQGSPIEEPWLNMAMGTSATPGIATGNTGYTAWQTGLSEPPAVFTGTGNQHANAPYRSLMMWMKVRTLV